MRYVDRINIEDILALTPVQVGMMWHYLKNPDSRHYVEQLRLEISGQINRDTFERAWNRVIETNEMLRTHFQWDHLKDPVQIILKSHRLSPQYHDLSDITRASERQRRLEHIIERDTATPFDLETVPFRVTLCTLTDRRHTVIISNHHILYDGWSNGIIIKEFFTAYHQIATGTQSMKAPVKTKFKEFVQWLQRQDRGEQDTFWKDFLKDIPPREGPPLKKRNRENSPAVDTGYYRTRLPHGLQAGAGECVRHQGTTLAALFYSAWGLLLQEYTAQSSVLFDTTVSGRSVKIKGIQDMVGLFINTLPLQARSRSNDTLGDVQMRVNRLVRSREAVENSSLEIVNEYMERYRQRSVLDSVVVIENYPLDLKTMEHPGTLTVDSYFSSGRATYDLTVIITHLQHIEITLTYNATFFDPDSIRQLARRFTVILGEMVNTPQKEVNRLIRPSNEERERLLMAITALTQPDEKHTNKYSEYIPPANREEEKLAEIWALLLRIDQKEVGRDTHFFDFGGHSLKATILAAEIHKVFNVKMPLPEIFNHPTLRQMAVYISHNHTGKDAYIPIPPVEKKEYYPMSQAQQRLYMLQRLDPESTAYNGTVVMMLLGEIHKDRIETAFQTLIRRHESLRTSFIIMNRQPVQRVHEEIVFNVRYEEALNQEQQASNRLINLVRPFDLSRAPLLRVRLIKADADEYLLMVDMHHIITDGTSTDILTRKLMSLYKGENLAPLEIQYRDFSEWQNERLGSGELKPREDYWLDHLHGELPVLGMSLDYPRPTMQRFEGHRVRLELEKTLTRRLKQRLKETGATLYMMLLTVYNILLHRYTGQEDIIIGTPTAGRNHADLGEIIGFFLETLAIRTRPAGHKTAGRFLNEVKKIALNAFLNQDYPFRELIKKKAVNETGLSRNPLFDVMLNVLNQDRSQLEMEGVRVIPRRFDPRVSKVDLTLEALEDEDRGRVLLELEYSTALFRETTIQRFARHFINTLGEVLDNPGLPISQIEIMSEEEKRQILEEFNGTDVPLIQNKPVHQWIEAQAVRSGDRVAVVGNIFITYNELIRKSRRLAGALKSKGVETGAIVALMAEPSVEMIVGILGILLAGAAYLPTDPGLPAERVDFMLRDSGANMLVSGLDGSAVRRADASGEPTKPTYIIYTSGSTGKPKGIVVNHQNLTTYLNAFLHEFEITSDDTVIQQASFSFDVSVEEVFPCLISGARLAIPPRDTVKDISLLMEFIQRHNVSIIDCSPLLLSELNRQVPAKGPNPLRSIRIFISGGDLLKREHIGNLLKNSTVYNTYGPTETTVCAAYHRIGKDGASNIPIGKPIANYRVYILDKNSRLLPIGLPGELCISGPGVTPGYLNRPERTAETFVTFSAVKIYKTGDLARWLDNGEIQFLGRIDHQVKIRGYRVELGEIGHRLQCHEKISEAVATTGESEEGIKYLCAYYIPAEGDYVPVEENVAPLGQDDLEGFLSNLLPAYMIPAVFIPLQRFPYTPSGKIDRNALPEPESVDVTSYTAPRNEMEKALSRIWRELVFAGETGKNPIGIDANFFKLGGHSLKATLMTSRIYKQFNVKIPLAEIFKAPTIRALARYLDDASPDKYTAIGAVEEKEYYPLSSAQHRFYILQQLNVKSTGYNIPSVSMLKGPVSVEKMAGAVRQLIRGHESLRTSFRVIDGEPVQKVWSHVKFEVEYFPVGGSFGTFIRPFDLSRPPLLRLGLTKFDENNHILMFDMHHIISDGISMNLFAKMFMALYNGEEIPPPRVRYIDFAQWQNNMMAAGQFNKQETFWQNQFRGKLPVLNMATDFPRPSEQSFDGDTLNFSLDPAASPRLNQWMEEKGVTLYMVLLVAFNILMYKYTGQEDIIIGSPIAGRNRPDLEPLIGLLLETLALRNYPSGSKSVDRFIGEVKENTVNAYDNRDYPFREIMKQVRDKIDESDLSRNPLFDVMLVVQNMEEVVVKIGGLELAPYPARLKQTSKVDLTIIAEEGDDGVRFIIEYCTALFTRAAVERLARHFVNIIYALPAEPGLRLKDIDIMDNGERSRLLELFNGEQLPYPGGQTLHRLFEEQAARSRDHTVITAPPGPGTPGDALITYRELDRRSHYLAEVIRKRGVEPGAIIAIRVERSIEMITGILGILKAGAAYLPIDTDLPEERVTYMLKDSGTGVLIGNGIPRCDTPPPAGGGVPLSRGELVEVRLIDLTELIRSDYPALDTGTELNTGRFYSPLERGGSPKARRGVSHEVPAYVIYTSGSTGKPKGVIVEHRNLLHYLHSFNRQFKITPSDTVVQQASYSFDVFAEEVYPLLLAGGKIVIPPKEEVRSGLLLSRFIARRRATIIDCSPLLLNELNQPRFKALLQSIRLFISGGDVLKSDYVDTLLEIGEVFNTYGPTESTICASYYRCSPGDPSSVPIGRPIANYRIFIQDKSGAHQPVGIPGELCVSGPGVARGYLNQPELTDKKFEKGKSALYFTGDLARWREDGNIQYLGRIDNQVKIRGYRIELGEIEHQLQRHPMIKDAVVAAGEDKTGINYLCAYVVPVTGDTGPEALSVTRLREYLDRHLPSYMIPSFFIEMKRIPYTSRGKIDRDALPDPGIAEGRLRTRARYSPPRNKMERKLADMWCRVLGQKRIGIDDDFFHLGGQSLLAMKIISMVENAFGVRIPLMKFFRQRTVKKITQTIIRMQAMGGEIKHTGTKGLVYPFDVTRGPLLRVWVVKLQTDRHLFFIDIHHIVADGISLDILTREFITRYSGGRLPGLTLQYKDFSHWQNRFFNDVHYHLQETYWLDCFKGEIPHLNLPTDFPRPEFREGGGRAVSMALPGPLVQRVRQFSTRHQITLFMLILSAYTIVLSKYSGQEDIVVGTPAAGRTHAGLDHLIGMFVDTLALRNFPRHRLTAARYLNDVKEKCLLALDNQDYQFDALIEKLGLAGETGGNPLFDTMFVLDHLTVEDHQLEPGRLKVIPYQPRLEVSQFDLTLTAVETGSGIMLLLNYDTSLFKEEGINELLRNVVNILSGMIHDPEIEIGQMDMWGQSEGNPYRGDLQAANPPLEKETYTAPRSEPERKLTAIWNGILDVDHPVGVHESFFDLGGDSLTATRMAAQIKESFHRKITAKEIFKAHTIDELARIVGQKREAVAIPLEPMEKKEYYPTSAVQKRQFLLNQLNREDLGYNIFGAIILEGTLDRERFDKVFKELILRHESLRTGFTLIEGKIVQVVHDGSHFKIGFYEIDGDETGQHIDIEKIINGEIMLRAVDRQLPQRRHQTLAAIKLERNLRNGREIRL
ncbi:MAG: amino acid adenylation domain-containing protein [bacterium]|nr:amino acid adenylation domain-containing protein [bacterium]